MFDVDERTERLIVRRLDGELSDEEALELDRELLRSPRARELLEEYKRIDGAAAAALAAAIPEDPGRAVPFSVQGSAPPAKRYSRWWWALPAAVAAGVILALTLFPPPLTDRPLAVSTVSPPTSAGPYVEPARVEPSLGGPSAVRQAAHGGGSLDRVVDQDLLYIIGDDGKIYVIDRQHMRTAHRPNLSRAIQQASGDL
jgi:anti-sigma factor RsiW